MAREEMKKRIAQTIDSVADDMWALSLRIHANPELAFKEYKASEWLSEVLAQNGFKVTKPVAGLDTAFSAAWTSPAGPGPTIALLSEYDALPGIGHACGHNIIGVASMTAGIALSKTLAKVPGTVRVVGTPAEEGGAGKVIMLEQGVFDGVDVAMMTHPGSKNTLGSTSLAACRLIFKFTGKPAHAASVPHEGINALDALLQTYAGINALRQHVPTHVRIHGIITNGGQAPNIVPEFAEAIFSVRSATQDYHEVLLEKVRNCARAGALATGAKVEIEQKRTYAVNRPNKRLARAFRSNMESLGQSVEDVQGGGGSTDFGNVSQAVPGLHPSINICKKPVPGHSHEMAEASCSEEGRKGMLIAAKTLALTSLDLFTDPGLLREVKEEFAAGTK